MYDRLDRRPGGSKRTVGARDRQEAAEAHVGHRSDFLSRHNAEAREAAMGPYEQRQRFAARLMGRIADTRNLMTAIEHLSLDGPKAPGPNGVRLESLNLKERWGLCQELNEQLMAGTYRPGPTQVLHKPKSRMHPERGTRPIELHNIEDLIVQRAITQVLQPLLDPRFSTLSRGFRPGASIDQTLCLVDRLLREDPRRMVWVTEDLSNAFTKVPHGRLMDVLRQILPEDVVRLIDLTVRSGRRRGIPQGGCLSPLLLNIYLDHFVDKPWQRDHGDTPLIRVADDLLILCRSREEAEEKRTALENMLRPTGMILKGTRETTIRAPQDGQPAIWLGLEFVGEAERVAIRASAGRLERLWEGLEEAHHGRDAQIKMPRIILGWIEQLGPCYADSDRGAVYSRMREMAAGLGYEEIPGQAEVEETWLKAWMRFQAQRRVFLLCSVSDHETLADGSASRHPQRAQSGPRGAAPNAVPRAQSAPSPEVRLVCDGACCPQSRIGGWAYLLVGPLPESAAWRADFATDTTNNRMELTAVIRGLEALDRPSRVQLLVDSRYVSDGLGKLPRWRANYWRRGNPGLRQQPLKNVDLWRRLWELTNTHQVQCEWVRGHSGHPEHDVVDALSRQAANRRVPATGFGGGGFSAQ